MRVWLKTLEKTGSRRWSDPIPFDRIELALVHWLALPHHVRIGGLIHEERESRKPTDAEVKLSVGRVNMGILLVSRDLANSHRHRIRVEEQAADLDSDYPRVKTILLPWHAYEERDVISSVVAKRLAERIRTELDAGPAAKPSAGHAEAKHPDRPDAAAARPLEDVIDAEWVEVVPGSAKPETPRAKNEDDAPDVPDVQEGRTAGIDVTAYRLAIGICTGLSPAAGRAYRATCEEAAERLREFVGEPVPNSARKAARTAHALLHALPRHFPSAEAAGRWAMVARPAIGAFAEATFAWAATAPVAAIAAAAPARPAAAPVEHGIEPHVGRGDASPSEPPAPEEGGRDAATIAVPETAGEPNDIPGATAALASAADADGTAEAGLAAPEPEPVVEPSRAAPVAEPTTEATVPEPATVTEPGTVPAKAAVPVEPRRRRPRVRKDAAPPAIEAAGIPEAQPDPAATPEPQPNAPAHEEQTGPSDGPRRLTATERKVLSVMSPRTPMRKNDISIASGIGRGSVNRIVDRLVQFGLCREPQSLRYVLSERRA